MPPDVSRLRPFSPELLTVDQVAELLGVSRRLVWLIAGQRDLVPVRIRRCTRWRRTDVLNYIERLPSQPVEVSRA